jgi:hypothetical protein
MLAVAFGGGIILSALFSALRGPAKIYAEPPSARANGAEQPSASASGYDKSASKNSSQSPGKLATATRKNLDALGGALLGIVATRTSSILEGLVPGFQKEFERAKNSQSQI